VAAISELVLASSLALALICGSVADSLNPSPRREATPIQTQPLPSSAVAYPLKASSNKRYLVDQENRPFLMIGDAPQTIITNLSVAEAATYIANRRNYGINTLWINLLCNFSEACNKTAITIDGIAPFLDAGDLSRPNPAYFERADAIIKLAASHGMLVLLDPIETSSWLPVLRAAGVDRAFAYGQYLGRRYKDDPNIIWMHGNDFQSWRNRTDARLVQAVARGIRGEDPVHIHTVELDYLTSGSLDDPTWAPLVELDAAYTYFPTFAQVLAEYNRPDFKPVFLVEASYEFEHNPHADAGSPQNLRRQQYWAMLSGATGHVYGSAYTWRLEKGWERKLDTTGAVQLRLMRDLFAGRKWYDLVPDQDHRVVIDGFDALAEHVGKLVAYVGNLRLRSELVARAERLTQLSSVSGNTYAATGRSADGTLVMTYLPSTRTITVDMSKLAGPASARWFDPTDGSYSAIAGSPFANIGSRQFQPPARNAAGDGDWVLVLETASSPE
jgi:hypothetical protein